MGGVVVPTRRSIGSENIVGQRIVKLRKERKMSQKDLLAQLQINNIEIGQSALSDLEGQRRKVSDKELVVLAKIFGVSVEELLREVDIKE